MVERPTGCIVRILAPGEHDPRLYPPERGSVVDIVFRFVRIIDPFDQREIGVLFGAFLTYPFDDDDIVAALAMHDDVGVRCEVSRPACLVVPPQ